MAVLPFFRRGIENAQLDVARIADNLGITIVFIHHCNKSVTQSAASRASGSTAFIDAVRAAIMCCQNPDDPQNRRVLSVTKSNLAEIPPGIGYTLCASPGEDVAHVEWEGSHSHWARCVMVFVRMVGATGCALIERVG